MSITYLEGQHGLRASLLAISDRNQFVTGSAPCKWANL